MSEETLQKAREPADRSRYTATLVESVEGRAVPLCYCVTSVFNMLNEIRPKQNKTNKLSNWGSSGQATPVFSEIK